MFLALNAVRKRVSNKQEPPPWLGQRLNAASRGRIFPNTSFSLETGPLFGTSWGLQIVILSENQRQMLLPMVAHARRFMSGMGHEQTSRNVRVMSVIPLKAVVDQRGLHVRFVPQAEVPDSRQRLAFDLLRSAANTTLRPCYARLV
jgi:hypothetical protein